MKVYIKKFCVLIKNVKGRVLAVMLRRIKRDKGFFSRKILSRIMALVISAGYYVIKYVKSITSYTFSSEYTTLI